MKITTTAADFSLDQTTLHIRVVIKSVALFSDANNPLVLDLYVKFVHPCYAAAFSDNGGVSATTIENVVFNAPHPAPLSIAVADFPYNLQGTVDCGTQTISIVNTPIAPGSMSDFISISNVLGVWTLTIEPINMAQEGLTFTLQLEVVLDDYNWITYTSPTTFDVFIKENCMNGSVDNFVWSSNASTVLPVQTVLLDNTQVLESFTGTPNLAHCSLIYEFLIEDSVTGTYVTYTDTHITVDSLN